MAFQGIPKWSKGCPEGPKKIPNKSTQGEKKGVKRHPREANKSQNYIHTSKIYANSGSTAIQRQTSTSRPLHGGGSGVCVYFVYVYIVATPSPTGGTGGPTKVTPRRALWEPKAPQRLPKGSPKLSKESKMSAKDIPMRPTNHKTIYTQAKYTQTPDPPPYSGRLVL